MARKNKKTIYIKWFSDISMRDLPQVGGKNASIGEMIKKLSGAGVRVPDGFAITADGYKYFLEVNNLAPIIEKYLKNVTKKNLSIRGKKIRHAILKAKIPPTLRTQLDRAYKKFIKKYGRATTLAVRSSATAEDLPTASFAGQQESFLNIKGEQELARAVRMCFASLFTDRAISYRKDMGFNHMKVYLSVGVQQMVRSDKGSAGVIFTLDTETGFRDAITINGSWGLGESVVKGRVSPDEFVVFKPLINKNFSPIISKSLGSKREMLIYGKASPTKRMTTPKDKQRTFCLDDKKILELAKTAVAIEKHYGRPMDIEWARDSKNIYIVQARPETVFGARPKNAILENYRILKKGKVLATGAAVGTKIGQGKSKIISSPKEIARFGQGEILVTQKTDPDWEPIMKRASGIVTESGGRTSHAAIVSRELGLPCIVGVDQARSKIKSGRAITISCAEGEVGKVYAGKIPFKIEKLDTAKIKRPKTKIMMNLGNPDQAFALSFIPSDGVGLAREEFIVTNFIKIHPQALLEPQKIKDKNEKNKILELTQGYHDKKKYFIDKLAFGVAKIAAAFWPKPVVIRLSDFKTNEYRNLIGGSAFEPQEENPMIGWRGASRYADPAFTPAFALEAEALKIVREKMGLRNIKIMIPFCRTPKEGQQVLEILSKFGIKKNKSTKIIVMCEIPSNIILADKFFDIFDGMSIGSNDLTQLILGVDRDSSRAAKAFDERSPAVTKMIASVIKKARARKKEIGICGQAPSDYPDFARFLVKQGITSISLTPDTVVKTTLDVLDLEKKLKSKRR